MDEDDPLELKVRLTPELRAVALVWLHQQPDDARDVPRMRYAFTRWRDGELLRSTYRIEADMLVVIAEALRHRSYYGTISRNLT